MLGLALNESTIYIYIILASINLKMEGAKTSDDWRSTLTKDEREAMELKISDRLLKLKIRITSGSLYNPMSGQMEKLLLDTIASEIEEWMFNNHS